jgi:hypothetical protein
MTDEIKMLVLVLPLPLALGFVVLGWNLDVVLF